MFISNIKHGWFNQWVSLFWNLEIFSRYFFNIFIYLLCPMLSPFPLGTSITYVSGQQLEVVPQLTNFFYLYFHLCSLYLSFFYSSCFHIFILNNVYSFNVQAFVILNWCIFLSLEIIGFIYRNLFWDSFISISLFNICNIYLAS